MKTFSTTREHLESRKLACHDGTLSFTSEKGREFDQYGGELHSKKTSGGGYHQSLYVLFASEWGVWALVKYSLSQSPSVLPANC